MAAVQLSVVIITFNEEKNIARCVESISSIADEIIILDSHSDDHTRLIAASLGARVFEMDFKGHVEQKNAALQLASFPHVLSLDADEAVDARLLSAIEVVKNNFVCDGYYLNRLTNYAGQWMRFGGWYPDRKLRLWDRRKGHWAGTNPHDRFEMMEGCRLGNLPGNLLHYSYESREAHIIQSRKFAETAANALFQQGQKAGFIKRFLSPVFRFFYSYLLRLGILEGAAGFHVAAISAWASYQKYRRLHQLNQSPQNHADRA